VVGSLSYRKIIRYPLKGTEITLLDRASFLWCFCPIGQRWGSAVGHALLKLSCRRAVEEWSSRCPSARSIVASSGHHSPRFLAQPAEGSKRLFFL